MTTRVVHCKKEPYDVYIGRPSKWGNPFSHRSSSFEVRQVDTSEEAIELYKNWILNNHDLYSSLSEIKGKTLGCWCKPGPCHGDVLAGLADSE